MQQITQNLLDRTLKRLSRSNNAMRIQVCVLGLVLLTGAVCFPSLSTRGDAESSGEAGSFQGSKAGVERAVAGIKLCWCPASKFMMGSPSNEPDRRPDEDQVEVTLTKGFWMAKFEETQGHWKRVIGELPGPLTEQLPEGGEFPVGNVNFAEAESFCRKLTEVGHQSGELPKNWKVLCCAA